MKLTDYIQLGEDIRRGHLNEDAPCQGATKIKPQRLLSSLGIEDDIPNWVKAKVTIGYICGGCGNPLHAYICRPEEGRRSNKERIKALLAPYQNSTQSNLAIAAETKLSPATIARYRKASGIDTSTWVGKDGKTYTNDTETRAVRRITKCLNEVATLLTPERATPEIQEIIKRIANATGAKL